MIWFTSDYHFDHANIIRYCNRPFFSLVDMNNTIINRHNERVKKEDIVFFIGDFKFKSGTNRGEGEPRKPEYFIKQLNGNFIFIRGNHDINNGLKTVILSLNIYYGKNVIHLTHNPKFANLKCKFNFVGHIHEKWKFLQKENSILINVGVDVWNFYPISYQEIMIEYQKWERNEN